LIFFKLAKAYYEKTGLSEQQAELAPRCKDDFDEDLTFGIGF